MNIDGSGLKQLTNNQSSKLSTATDNDPSFSPNGKEIVFISRRQGNETKRPIYNFRDDPIGENFFGGTFDVYIMDSEGRYQIPLTYNTVSSHPFFSPDGGKIIFNTSLKSNRNQNSLKIIDVISRKEKILNFSGGMVKFSLDGKWVFDNFGHDISVMNVDGNSKVKLTHFSDPRDINNSDLGMIFTLSADGEKISLVTIKSKNNSICRIFKFYTMNIDGSDLREVYELEAIKAPGFIFTFKYSPDGNYIIFNASIDGNGIYLLNLADKTLMNLTEGKEYWRQFLDFTFTPDGKKIVFVADIFSNSYKYLSIFQKIKMYIKYFLFKKSTPSYDNKYICIMDIDGSHYRRIAKLPIGSELGRDFIHWE
jgi:Tol biopolymer transport system component